jgi:NADPH2:quinone reductase
MRAVLCEAWGPPESLILADLPEPRAGQGEAVVRVAATALNFLDTLIVQGRYQHKPPFPFSPGAEIAGVVDSVGAAVTGVRVGERVIANLGWGGAREKVVVQADRLIPVPDAVGDEAAAGLLVAYGTTLHAFRQSANLQPGETVAVLGASGGVGLAAVELGKRLGARVIAVSSGAKLDVCCAAGADGVIDYETEDLKERLRALTDGRGVDVVYDAVGDRFTEPAVRALARGGRHLVIGFAAGEIPRIPLNLLLLKSASLLGVNWGLFAQTDPATFRANARELLDLVARGDLEPPISETYPLERTGEAIRRLADRKVTGKVIVKPSMS